MKAMLQGQKTDISDKADKTYVDTQNQTQDNAIRQTQTRAENAETKAIEAQDVANEALTAIDNAVLKSDKATEEDAKDVANDTKWITPKTTNTFFMNKKASDSEVTEGIETTKWVSPADLKKWQQSGNTIIRVSTSYSGTASTVANNLTIFVRDELTKTPKGLFIIFITSSSQPYCAPILFYRDGDTLPLIILYSVNPRYVLNNDSSIRTNALFSCAQGITSGNTSIYGRPKLLTNIAGDDSNALCFTFSSSATENIYVGLNDHSGSAKSTTITGVFNMIKLLI